MFKKTKVILIFIFSFSLLSCGFKKIDQNNALINLKKINITGEVRDVYILKNNIELISDENAADKYTIEIKLSKKKMIKKNKDNRASSYSLYGTADLLIKDIDNKKVASQVFTRNVDYDVESFQISTIARERNASKKIMQELSEDIIKFVFFSIKTR